MAGYSSIAGLVNIQVRLVLARTVLALGDRVGAQMWLDESRALLRSWPDAVLAGQQVDRLEQQIRMAERTFLSASSPLTAAELKVLHLLPTNLRHREIAERLFVSPNTVKTHAASIYRKLGVGTRQRGCQPCE